MNCTHPHTMNIEAAYDGGPNISYSRTYFGKDLAMGGAWCTDCGAMKVGDAWVLPKAAAEKLAVFTCDDEEWVVASSARDARDVYCHAFGIAPVDDDKDGADPGARARDWEELPPEKILKIAEECPEKHTPAKDCPRGCDDNFMLHHAKTCAEWTLSGRGYLCSRNG